MVLANRNSWPLSRLSALGRTCWSSVTDRSTSILTTSPSSISRRFAVSLPNTSDDHRTSTRTLAVSCIATKRLKCKRRASSRAALRGGLQPGTRGGIPPVRSLALSATLCRSSRTVMVHVGPPEIYFPAWPLPSTCATQSLHTYSPGSDGLSRSCSLAVSRTVLPEIVYMAHDDPATDGTRRLFILRRRRT
jgi:hypothetical protein